MTSEHARDRGVATGLVVAAALLFLAGSVAVIAVLMAQMLAHRAQGAADLTALAGAMAQKEGTASPCAAAGATASAHQVRLLSCEVHGRGLEFVVTTEVTAEGWGWGAMRNSARAKAHAGVVVP